jgi:hypothetical protein
MPKAINKKAVLIVLFCAFFVGLVSGIQKASLFIADKDSYVEVKGSGIAYVPRTAKYVKYDGRIRKITKFVATISAAEEECPCPKCCKGYCYVVIYTDVIPMGSPVKILYILWVEC